MKCPYCGHRYASSSRARPQEDGSNRRYLTCRNCKRSYQTLETVDRSRLDLDPGQMPVLQLPAQQDPTPPRRQRQSRRIQDVDADAVVKLLPPGVFFPPELIDGIRTWWNESRRSRHGNKAVWSTRALKQSLDRLARLDPPDAMALVAAGIEHGWQALKPEYLGKQPTTQEEGVMPKDPAMRAALNQFNA